MRYLISLFCLLIFCLPMQAQQYVVPIVHGITLLGGTQDGKWLSAETTESKLKDETAFSIINLTGIEKNTKIGTKGENQDVCSDNPVIEIGETDEPSENNRQIALGANAKWNPLPRLSQALNSTDKTYMAIVADFLKTKGIVKTKIEITQVFRIDLEGDGLDEIVLTASYFKNGYGEVQGAGDYSFALLRKTVNGKPQNILLDGDFYSKKADSDSPSEHEIAALADLNGDGKLEIVLYVGYYEGNRETIYEMKNDKPVKVLESECWV